MNALELLLSMALMVFFLGVFVSFIVYLGITRAQEYAERELKMRQFLEMSSREEASLKAQSDQPAERQ